MLFAAVWAVGAVLLWRTTIPSGLHVASVDASHYVSDRAIDRAEHFQHVLRLLWIFGTLTQLAVLVVLALLGRRIAAGFDLGKVGTGVLVGTFATLCLWITGLPFGFLSLWWERRYNLSEQGYADWLLEQWPSLLGQVVGLTILLTFLMLLGGWLRRSWWLVAGPILVGVGALIVYVVSFAMTIGMHPIRDRTVAQDVRRLAHKEGVEGTKVRVQKISDQTHAINAMAVGPAQVSAVIVWDTVFDGRLKRREIDVIVAHEFGHIARKDIWRGIGWSALFTLPLLFLLSEATRRRGGIDRPEVVPFALLVLAVLSLVALPVQNAISRRIETEADWFALKTTRDPAAARGLFAKFTTADLAEPNPPLWDYVMLEDHPTIAQRIAFANAWEKYGG